MSEFYELKDYIGMLPENIAALIENGFVRITEDAAERELAARAYGLSGADSLAVWNMITCAEGVRVGGATLYIGSAENLLHEMGHVMDALYGTMRGCLSTMFSSEPRFLTVFVTEAWTSGVKAYFTGNQAEYFAESFSDWCLMRAGIIPDERISEESSRAGTLRAIGDYVDILETWLKKNGGKL